METCELGAWPFRKYKNEYLGADISSHSSDNWLDASDVAVTEATVDSFDFEPKTNDALVLGCDKDCRVIVGPDSSAPEHVFKCPLVWEHTDG